MSSHLSLTADEFDDACGPPASEHDAVIAERDRYRDGWLRRGRDINALTDVLDFVQRTVKDPDLFESEVRERIDSVVGRTLDRLGGHS